MSINEKSCVKVTSRSRTSSPLLITLEPNLYSYKAGANRLVNETVKHLSIFRNRRLSFDQLYERLRLVCITTQSLSVLIVLKSLRSSAYSRNLQLSKIKKMFFSIEMYFSIYKKDVNKQ